MKKKKKTVWFFEVYKQRHLQTSCVLTVQKSLGNAYESNTLKFVITPFKLIWKRKESYRAQYESYHSKISRGYPPLKPVPVLDKNQVTPSYTGHK